MNTSGRNYEMSELRRYFLAVPPLRAMWLLGSKLKHRVIHSKRKHTKFDLRYFLALPPLTATNLIRPAYTVLRLTAHDGLSSAFVIFWPKPAFDIANITTGS